MNDKLLMENMLLLLKSTVEVYVHGSLESVNTLVHKQLKNCLDEIIKMQYDLYNKMTEQGWYVIKNTTPKEIEKTYKKIQNN